MKKMISGIAVLLCMVLMCSFMTGCFGGKADFTVEGIMMSVDDFKAYFTNEKTLEECTSKSAVYAGGSGVEVTSQYISYNLLMSIGDDYELSSLVGQFFGDKTAQAAGVDATVAVLTDTMGDMTTILFQIWNSNEKDDNLLFHKELSGQPHLKIYMIDRERYLHFYELPLPEKMAGVSGKELDSVDAFDKWYETFFKAAPEVEG